MVPGVLSTTGVISTPFSTVFEILKTASDMAQEMNTDASARFRPGQIRLPKPKQIVLGSCCGSLSSELIYRVGLKSDGSGYTRGSFSICLGVESKSEY
jgi:hypothetical protein